MKKSCFIFMSVLLLWLAALPLFAESSPPEIICQPQNPTYNAYSVALYSVTAEGSDLSCTWHLVYDGVDYNISVMDDNFEPWEGYAGEQYGNYSEESDGQTTFSYYFQGIDEGLSGSKIYAVIDNGSQSVTSDMAYIYVLEDVKMPPTTVVPASVELFQGEAYTLFCEASVTDGSDLSYLWYSTSTGDIRDITAVNRGGETSPELLLDAGTVGTQYYCCMVTSENGGNAYSSLIKVTVKEPIREDDTETVKESETTLSETDEFEINTYGNNTEEVSSSDRILTVLIAVSAVLAVALVVMLFTKDKK